ncbi:prolipoprotein diacylglyceryl transferase [Wenjunlia tyrosinilytica]|uniref:Phosphatidylglycerol--prolipoprotein diacylglyceryl transferase n=1 Tax=Wenjunlia tyrosinilytica TaxID=1544741 RepID=A0A917ZE18_9ACTN|nr:prolipoprotein diacylglyceryl transferase [Wenjunlia tyrosinilytica]GGO81620.1 prolipoprotein diacylglyceryl transferase 1 [Wenjunlia tyrosinilytica]
MELAYIPSPSRGVIYLGPIPLRGYAFCIILGVFIAIWLGNRRWIARGGQSGTVADIAVWAVPFGLIGGRLYHVITTYEPYFGKGGHPVDALKIWEGGLGIWGAIALGALGAWIGCRRRGIALPAYADSVAPGIALAQAVGRWGNWFNQELYGKPTTLPWAVRIDPDKRPAGSMDVATYHPTFLYEFLWCIGVALLVIWADKRFRLGHGRAFALYVAAYTVGRFWIEYLRIDEAHHILGLRLNDWTSILVFAGAVAYLVISAKKRPGREEIVEPRAALAEGEQAESTADAAEAEAGDGRTGEDRAGEDRADDGRAADAKANGSKPSGAAEADSADSAGNAETRATGKPDLSKAGESANGESEAAADAESGGNRKVGNGAEK